MRAIRPRSAFLIVLVSLLLALPASAGARAGEGGAASRSCAAGKLSVAGGCVSRAAAGKHVRALVREAVGEMGLRAAIVRVDTGSQPLAEFALGNSMTGTPARPDMYFRIGSMAIPHMITVLLQLQDEGRLSVDVAGGVVGQHPQRDPVRVRQLRPVLGELVVEREPYRRLPVSAPESAHPRSRPSTMPTRTSTATR